MGQNTLESLVDLVRQLRAPDGCPWDREQTHESITGFLIEEAYEVIHAIKEENYDSLKDELGDLLLHIAFHAQLASEADRFQLQDVLDNVHEKVIRRHPHVFGETGPKEIGEVKLKWEELKAAEKKNSKSSSHSFPALVEARKLIEKHSNTGEYENLNFEALPDDLERKLRDLVRKENEPVIGQLLFKIVEMARAEGIEAEIALKEQNKTLRDAISESGTET